jgi:hypothetical protein
VVGLTGMLSACASGDANVSSDGGRPTVAGDGSEDPGEADGAANGSGAEGGVTSDAGAAPSRDATTGSGPDATGSLGGEDAGGDAATDAGGTGCAGLLCENFESGGVDPTRWTTMASGGTLEVQQQQVAHGLYAAHLHGLAGPSDDWALLVPKSVPAALRGSTTFGRVYFFVTSDASASVHIQLAFAGRNGAGGASGPAPFPMLRSLEVGSSSGIWQLGFDLFDVSPSVEEVSYSKNGLPTNTWSCLEWEFEDQPDRVTAWIDGASASTFDNTNVGYANPGPIPEAGAPLYKGTSTGIIGGFETFAVGFHDWEPKKAFDLYYDDLVLDAKRVGCLP